MPSTPATTVVELADVQKSFGAVRALRSASISVQAGSIHALVGENGAGKSTLIKIVAGVYRRDAGTFRFQGDDVDFGSTAESKAAGIAVIYQEPTLFPDLSVTENIFMGRQPLRSRPSDRPRPRCTPRPTALFERLGVAHRPAPPGPRPVDRRPADHRDRQGHLARRQPPDHGRAHRGAERRRGGPAVRGRPQPARRGPRAGVHLAPLRRGLRALRHGHRDAGRRVRLDPADRRHHRRPAGLAHGRARGRRPLPEDAGSRSATSCSRSRASSRRARSTTSASRSGPARSSVWPAWSAPAAARSRGRSSASTATRPARSGWPDDRSRSPTRAPRSAPAWPSSPRTAASRDW